MSANLTKAEKLAAAAAEAAEVRRHQVNPDVAALNVERSRTLVDRLIWTGLIMGLAFTMVNVAEFAAGDARPPWVKHPDASFTWVTAWLLDPMVSLVLIGVLRGEQIINRYGLHAGGWVRAAKWVTLICTYGMNTWASWVALDASDIVLHSVPPLVVFVAAEAVVKLRQKITEAVDVAHAQAVKRARGLRELANQENGAELPAETVEAIRTDEAEPTEEAGRSGWWWKRAAALVAATRTDEVEPTRTDEVEPTRTDEVEPTRTDEVEPTRTDEVEPTRTDDVEPTRTDDVEPTRTDDVEPTRKNGKPSTRKTAAAPKAPSAREVARTERAALVERLAGEIRAAAEAETKWAPNYAELVSGGKSRRWAEMVVSDARKAATADGWQPYAEAAEEAAKELSAAPEPKALPAAAEPQEPPAADADQIQGQTLIGVGR